MRYSRQRDLILQVLHSGALEHPTAQAVHDAVREQLPRISLGTVYRNLRQLVESGQLRVLQREGVLLVDTRLEPHAHFVCERCGALHDLDLDLESLQATVLRGAGHRVDHAEIHLRGSCARCLDGEPTQPSISAS
jgi:Fur family transcriptional regulator, peroxide stress response regulator